ncbi:hypothetical protein [Lachnospira pectinoschiza]|uniref:hypothetical protein n=1 Tax=Lachnospira pectinoschiza TaxID=28052 RepID=UPI003F81C69A
MVVSIPFGVSVLPNLSAAAWSSLLSFNPLWGFCSSKQSCDIIAIVAPMFQSPLGFLFFQTKKVIPNLKRIIVSIPFGVSVLPNSISAIPVFMRAKLAICGEESFFCNFPTEISLKMSLSPVFMRCAVKFIFSFIAFIYYNGNFL